MKKIRFIIFLFLTSSTTHPMFSELANLFDQLKVELSLLFEKDPKELTGLQLQTLSTLEAIRKQQEQIYLKAMALHYFATWKQFAALQNPEHFIFISKPKESKKESE